MIDRETLNIIGRRLRTENDARPKGPIPDRLWKLLLALESAEKSRSH